MTERVPSASRPSYHPEHFTPLFAAEDRHFWFRSRNRCIAAATRLLPNPSAIKDILEHGCGTGFVLSELQRLFPDARVTGADLFEEGLAMARQRFAGKLVQADLFRCGFRSEFDLIGLFDVLEHLDDDLQALLALREQLRPGGHLLITVPAHMVLWSDYDIASGHRRRYTRAQLVARLAEADFQVQFCTEFMLPLFPLVLIRRRLRLRQNLTVSRPANAAERIKSELQINPLLNRILDLILRPEAPWIACGRRLLGGTSILALAERMPKSNSCGP
jgi:SAM-dependent methyltransferase